MKHFKCENKDCTYEVFIPEGMTEPKRCLICNKKMIEKVDNRGRKKKVKNAI